MIIISEELGINLYQELIHCNCHLLFIYFICYVPYFWSDRALRLTIQGV